MLLVVVIGQLPAQAIALAARGLPDSAEFGFGVRLDPWGKDVELALKATASMQLDWVGIDFDWARLWADQGQSADLAPLTETLKQLQQHGTAVMLSITHAPAWAMTPSGPDPAATAQMVSLLISLAPGAVKAVEIFPGANTVQGWGVPPHPTNYAEVLKHCIAGLQEVDSQVTLIAGGLIPNPIYGMDDLIFLHGLYEAINPAYLPVISLRLVGLSGEAMAFPGNNQPAVLRHYEQVRQEMLENQHTNGLIWITGFSWPETANISKTEGAALIVEQSREIHTAQVNWLVQSYRLMRSQLYIGTAFFSCFNQPLGNTDDACLIQNHSGQTSLHPAMVYLGQLITVAHLGASMPQSEVLKKVANPEFKVNLKVNIP